MVYLGEKHSRDPTSAARWFNVHPDLTPILATEVANLISIFEVAANGQEMVEETGLIVGPPTKIWVQEDGKDHNLCLVYYCLTCSFQIRWLRLPHPGPNQTAIASRRTLSNIGRYSNPSPSVRSSTRRSWDCPLGRRLPAVVRPFSAWHLPEVECSALTNNEQPRSAPGRKMRVDSLPAHPPG